MARLFVSQEQMDSWTTEGRVSLEDDVMNLPALGRAFRLDPAVYFSAMVEGADVRQMLGKVKSLAQLAAMGAEHYTGSVIFGETGYECVDGFLGTPVEATNIAASGLLRLEP